MKFPSRAIATLPNSESRLEPGWISGFIDGEGCFNIKVVKNQKFKTGFNLELRFSIGLHAEDKPLLDRIKNKLKVGTVIKQGSQYFVFRLSSVDDIKVLINHLDKYPLLSKKCADYQLWKKAFNIGPAGARPRWTGPRGPVKSKKHLTIDGLRKIVAIKATMNWGLSPKLKSAFPDIVCVKRPLVKNNQILDPNWIAGFAEAEGSFMIKADEVRATQLVFQLVQHSRNQELIQRLREYFDCGGVYESKNSFRLIVTKFSDIEKIRLFFQNYPLIGRKSKDFEDWCKAAELIKNKAHLTSSGLQEILKLKTKKNFYG